MLCNTITNFALKVTSGSAVGRLRRIGVRSLRACGSAISSGRRGDFDNSGEDGRANWCRSACEAERVVFGTLVGGSALSAKAMEEVAVVVFVAARTNGCGTNLRVVDACFATDTAGELASYVRRLRGRDLRELGDFYAGAIIVDDEAAATLVCNAVGAGRKDVVGRGSFDCFGAVPTLSGC